jgi:hypothetical protein
MSCPTELHEHWLEQSFTYCPNCGGVLDRDEGFEREVVAALASAISQANEDRTGCLFCGGNLYSYYGRRAPELGHADRCPAAVLLRYRPGALG